MKIFGNVFSATLCRIAYLGTVNDSGGRKVEFSAALGKKAQPFWLGLRHQRTNKFAIIEVLNNFSGINHSVNIFSIVTPSIDGIVNYMYVFLPVGSILIFLDLCPEQENSLFIAYPAYYSAKMQIHHFINYFYAK